MPVRWQADTPIVGVSRTILAAAAALAVSVPGALASVPPYGPPVVHNPFAHPHPYVNPVSDPAWGPARTDMGVDWIPKHKLAVRAIGDAEILGSDSHSDWPGHHIIWYELLDGTHAGDVVYVAEHLKSLVPTGTFVRAGQKIGVALPGYPWTEWGWANAYGSPVAYPCYKHDGMQTAAGKEMARFMQNLGAKVYNRPGPGPSHPLGKHCS